MERADQRARVTEFRVEPHAPVARAVLPRVVEEDPADRNLERVQRVDVLVELRRARDHVAPLDELELRCLRQLWPADRLRVGGDDRARSAGEEVVRETGRFRTELDDAQSVGEWTAR